MNNILLIFLCVIVFAIALYVFMATRGRIILGGRAKIKDLVQHPRTKSEAEVIKIIEELTHEEFPTVNPNWLRYNGTTLELDGYSEKLKIAVEFSGPLHTKWYPDKESYQHYFNRIVKDIVKKQVCKKNNVNLIVIDISLPRVHLRNYLRSRLYDIGFIADKPLEYINEQTAKPFRNKPLEKELGLDRKLCKLKNL